VLAVSNSEFKYFIISMYFFVVSFAVPLNVSPNKITIAFLDRWMSKLSVHEICEGYGGIVAPTPHPEAPPAVHFSLVENISINLMNISIMPNKAYLSGNPGEVRRRV